MEEKKSGLTAKALMENILKHMTAEQALEKLLQSSLIQYERLKMPDGDQAEPVHPIFIISMAAMDMGWEFAIPNDENNPNSQMTGMVVGTADYMQKIFPGEDDKEIINDGENSQVQSSI